MDLVLLIRLWYGALFRHSELYLHSPIWRIPGYIFRGALVVILATTNSCCLLLDNLFFPNWRKVKVRNPIFIVGVQRSGTTLMLRLLSSMKGDFTSFLLWEHFFAPSIIQKHFYGMVGRLDKIFGGHIRRTVEAIENISSHKMEGIHPSGLFGPEEDEMIFLRQIASIHLLFRFPFADSLAPFAEFDQKVPDKQRKKLMKDYADLVKRHIYVYGSDLTFVAKSPAFTPKIVSLSEVFPDAKFIVMVRDPREAIPSTISFLRILWKANGIEASNPDLVEASLLVADHWYTYPAKVFASWPQSRHMFCRYPDLISNPQGTVKSIFERFTQDLSPKSLSNLAKSVLQEGHYRSKNHYCPEDFGLTSKGLAERYHWVIKRWELGDSPNPEST